jgi:molecular chaperone GrpE
MENENGENKEEKEEGKKEENRKNEAGRPCECGEDCACREKESKSLEEKLAECQKEREEYLNGWKRARADYLNYRNEEADRISMMVKFSQEGLALEILPLLDNFNLIAKEIPAEKMKDLNVAGIIQVKTQLEDFLKSYGVEEIKALGEKFDPNFHEVVGEAAVEGKESGTVVEVVNIGYKINGRVLRPAKVKVTK